MAPIIPTCRPLVTPLRAAISVAVLALVSSVVPVVDAARAGPQASSAGQDCRGHAAEADTFALVASAALHKPPTP